MAVTSSPDFGTFEVDKRAKFEKRRNTMNEKEVDFYRDTPARYLGYSNEVGESFRSLLHVNWVRLSYGIATAYVLADTYDKASKQSKGKFHSSNERTKQVSIVAADTVLWQGFASVIIPGFTINRLCAGSMYTLKKTTKLPKITRKWITTAIGLASIPFIIHPIDKFVDYAMDNTFRVLFDVKPASRPA